MVPVIQIAKSLVGTMMLFELCLPKTEICAAHFQSSVTQIVDILKKVAFLHKMKVSVSKLKKNIS